MHKSSKGDSKIWLTVEFAERRTKFKEKQIEQEDTEDIPAKDLTTNVNTKDQSNGDRTIELHRDLVEENLQGGEPTINLERNSTNQILQIHGWFNCDRCKYCIRGACLSNGRPTNQISKVNTVDLKIKDHQKGRSIIGSNDGYHIEYIAKEDPPLPPLDQSFGIQTKLLEDVEIIDFMICDWDQQFNGVQTRL